LTLMVLVILFTMWRRSDLTEDIENRLAQSTDEITIADQKLTESQILLEFYQNRDFLEVWSKNGKISGQGDDFIQQLEDSKFEGLNPVNYHFDAIQEILESKKGPLKKLSKDELVDLEFLMSDAFLRFARDLEVGAVDPATLDSNWMLEEEESEISYTELLDEIGSGTSVEKQLDLLRPKTDLYQSGREVIRDLYQTLEKDTLEWKTVAFEKSLEPGDSHEAISGLRQRLIFWEFTDEYEVEDELVFDSKMEEALKKYQETNGMNPDGKIGILTADALNKSPQDLIDIASINLERLRWIPEITWDDEMVLVNIANYQLDYIQNQDTTLSAKIIVGKEYNESPVFTAPMSYIVFSPYWNIPESIVKDEIMPAVLKNKNYLQEKNMEVVSKSGEPVNERSVDWKVKDMDEFPYLVRQKPGEDNSLGLVKFMFPNEYNIYIHDTPARGLFEQESRALSHGCIRIQYPDEFAKVILNDSEWTTEKIHEAMKQEEEETVQLDRKIPVVILYLTFWADKSGKANFRQDIYERDLTLLKALRS